MTEIMNISGIECYEKDGMAYLKLEPVARGLGFTDNSKGTEYVRWNTVRGYLEEIGFSQGVAKDGFIPENVFYRLAMKAKNETAEKFQALVEEKNDGLFAVKECFGGKNQWSGTQTMVTPKGRETFRLLLR